MKTLKTLLLLLSAFLCGHSTPSVCQTTPPPAEATGGARPSYKEWPKAAARYDDSFFHTEEAARIGENVLLYQLTNGGWPKNIYIPAQLSPEERQTAAQEKNDVRRGTIDNHATTTEITYLSRLYNATRDARFREGALRGIAYLLEAQYPNGGWPQFYPGATGYHAQITFNDNAMVNVLNLLRQVSLKEQPYTYVPDSIAVLSRKAFEKGIDCILRCQVKQQGRLTVWCAQHDRNTLAPCKARAYELPSLSGAESVGITLLLMSLPRPSAEVSRAIEGAVEWFRTSAVTDLKRENFVNADGLTDYRMVRSSNAPRVWARFYETETNRPFFCGRDGIRRYDVSEIEHERRNGYSWYSNAGEKVLRQYEKWRFTQQP